MTNPYRPPTPWDPAPDYQAQEAPRKHSGLGIASFVMALVVGAILLTLIIIAGVLSLKAGGRMDEKSPEAVALGCSMISLVGVALLGAILGLVGMFLPRRKKLFAILGLIFNGLIVLGTGGLIIVGMLMK